MSVPPNALAPPLGQSWRCIFLTIYVIFQNKVQLDSVGQADFDTLHGVNARHIGLYEKATKKNHRPQIFPIFASICTDDLEVRPHKSYHDVRTR